MFNQVSGTTMQTKYAPCYARGTTEEETKIFNQELS